VSTVNNLADIIVCGRLVDTDWQTSSWSHVQPCLTGVMLHTQNDTQSCTQT